MEERKYFKYKVTELEALYEGAGGDCAILEDLEEELSHRSTQRARKLLQSVQGSLDSNSGAKAPSSQNQYNEETYIAETSPPVFQNVLHDVSTQEEYTTKDDEPAIEWDKVIGSKGISSNDNNTEPKSKALHNRPTDILDAWTAMEALSPQSYKRPNDLVIGSGSVAYLKHGQEPWLKGEKSRPKNNLYYIVYLGAVDLEKATRQLLDIYQDKRVEFPQSKGFAALGAVILDKRGVPIPASGLALSSFGWSYARALSEKLDKLKSWDIAEEILKDGLEKIIYPQSEDGEPKVFSLAKAEQVYHWLLRNCEIPEVDCVSPGFAIRLYQPFSKGEPDTPLLNSFFLEDLQKVKYAVQKKEIGKAVSQYLRIEKSAEEFDILADKSHIENALQPKNMPLGRWPSKGRHALVLLQQAAVNMGVKQLENDGLFSVNGPPGTGKTTLLRDVVAHVLIKRAKALYEFKDIDDAFKHAGQMKLGAGFVHLYKLHESLRGHEILVASTNNKAVENVSKELPLREQIAEDINGLNYFKTVSDALSKDDAESWGLVAAVLGNSKNRSEFINKAWWDNDSGLRQYFLSITGQRNFECDDDGNEIIPKVIDECDPPESLEEAKQRWKKAREEFAKALQNAEKVKSISQQAYEWLKLTYGLKEKIGSNKKNQSALENNIVYEIGNRDRITSFLESLNSQLSGEKNKETQSKKIKPGFFKRLFARDLWRSWKAAHKIIMDGLSELNSQLAQRQNEFKQSKNSISSFKNDLVILEAEEKILTKEHSELMERINKASSICGGKLVTPDLWKGKHEEQQIFTPNYTAGAQKLRDNLFLAAIKLHKAFIDASAKQLRQNLGVYFYCLGGGSLPQDKQHLLPHLWSSAFLLTPVMSTAFASVGRMLKTMPKETIGWLLIDEAGQATPQAAIGAIYRSKRVMSVGDPLQIEPVVTLSPAIVEGISKFMEVDPDHWMAPDASVQTVSDNANLYGTTIPRDLSEIRIGAPLLVHRRCADPMFSISNRLAYNTLMVHATPSKHSDITQLYGSQSAWFDVKGSAQEKWSPEEGEYVCDMLLRGFEHFSGDPDIFVITPFRNVAYSMRRRMQSQLRLIEDCGIEDPNNWIANNIGTVHTFQGKEAQAVILLLGAPSPAQNGARNWATSNVNLLNVAVSRAKQNFYIVGNRELWGDLGHMKLISRYIE